MTEHHWRGSVCHECEADVSWCDNPPQRPNPRDLIAKGVRPWIGDGEWSVGISKINDEMSYRAADNVIRLLEESGLRVTGYYHSE